MAMVDGCMIWDKHKILRREDREDHHSVQVVSILS